MLRVKPTGFKSWLFNYPHPVTKKRSNIGIGTFPIPSLAQAREIIKEYIALLAHPLCAKTRREE